MPAAAFWLALAGVVGLAGVATAAGLAIRDALQVHGSDLEAADEAAAEPYPEVPAGLIPDFREAGSPPAAVPADAEVDALAHMLASEDTRDAGARLVIGWQAADAARRRHLTVLRLLTRGDGYGPQNRGGKAYYASTAREPGPEDVELAGQILRGERRPTEAIRTRPGGWVERRQLAGQLGRRLSGGEQDARLLEKQADWSEGVWCRLAGTKWYLFWRGAPQLAAAQCAAVRAAKLAVAAAGGTAKAGPDLLGKLEAARAALGEIAPALLDNVPEYPAEEA